MLLKKYLSKTEYTKLFDIVKSTGIIPDFDYGMDGDTRWVSVNGKRSEQARDAKDFNIIVGECISRLSALPHIMLFNEYLTKSFCGDLKDENTGVRSTGYKDKYDFDLYQAKRQGTGRLIGHTTVEVKCRDGQYTLEYYKNPKCEGVLLDLSKNNEAEFFYTQTSDGYGLIFTMDKPDSIEARVSNKNTSELTGEKVIRDRMFFGLDKAILMEDPIDGTEEEFNKLFEKLKNNVR